MTDPLTLTEITREYGAMLAAKDAEIERLREATALTNEQKEMTFLRILEAMGGVTDSSEHKHNWINWFCSDEIHNVQDDTFNRCHAKGYVWTTHNTDWDTSKTTLTDAGRAALSKQEG